MAEIDIGEKLYVPSVLRKEAVQQIRQDLTTWKIGKVPGKIVELSHGLHADKYGVFRGLILDVELEEGPRDNKRRLIYDESEIEEIVRSFNAGGVQNLVGKKVNVYVNKDPDSDYLHWCNGYFTTIGISVRHE